MNKMNGRYLAISVVMGLALGGVAAPAVAATPGLALEQVSVAMTTPGAVSPGAFCSNAGATGKTKAGTKMKCKTTAKDTRLRWRRA